METVMMISIYKLAIKLLFILGCGHISHSVGQCVGCKEKDNV